MIPTLTQGKLRVHYHVELDKIYLHDNNFITISAICHERDAKFKFTLVGKNNIKRFVWRFKKGDLINVMSEDWVIKRIFKGIEAEV